MPPRGRNGSACASSLKGWASAKGPGRRVLPAGLVKDQQELRSQDAGLPCTGAARFGIREHQRVLRPDTRGPGCGPDGAARGGGTLTFSPFVPFRPRMPSAPCTDTGRVSAHTSEPSRDLGPSPTPRPAERSARMREPSRLPADSPVPASPSEQEELRPGGRHLPGPSCGKNSELTEQFWAFPRGQGLRPDGENEGWAQTDRRELARPPPGAPSPPRRPEPVSPAMRSPGQRRHHPAIRMVTNAPGLSRLQSCPSWLRGSLPALLRPRTGPRPPRRLGGPGCSGVGSREGNPGGIPENRHPRPQFQPRPRRTHSARASP